VARTDVCRHGLQLASREKGRCITGRNRLGFVSFLAVEVAESGTATDSDKVRKVRECQRSLEAARLEAEDTFCPDAMTNAERTWLHEHHAPVAAHWNLVTHLRKEHLACASN
jgi:hypothetical protein